MAVTLSNEDFRKNSFRVSLCQKGRRLSRVRKDTDYQGRGCPCSVDNIPSGRYVVIMKEHQKKQPVYLRTRLLGAAGEIAAAGSVDAVTLDKVARNAGVSKGGLLHHFPSRQALIEALCEDMFQKWSDDIARRMHEDPIIEGRFTRAYIRSSLCGEAGKFNMRLVGALTMAMSWDASLRNQWKSWLEARISLAEGRENTPERCLARAAADGLWLADYTGVDVLDPCIREAIVRKLIEETYERKAL
ncbi:MAG: TetR/AcrR family transcriptional regulator [Deltaproteobacteria bacterium]|nr:TetR/AcrR family transcriptional regulator [Deltaproteobacteria bacterium]